MAQHRNRSRSCFSALLAVAALASGRAFADSGALFYADGVVPLPPEVASLHVRRPDEPVYVGPSTTAEKRGAAGRDTYLPIFGAQRGTGCAGRWFLVGPEAFICEDGVEPSARTAEPLDAAPRATDQGLPFNYFFVSREGSFGYRDLATAEDGVPDTQLQPGFGIAVTRVQNQLDGDPFGLTSHGFWVPLRDLGAASPVGFEGSAWSPALAWVVRDAAALYSAPGKRRRGATLERLTTVHVLETRALARQLYCRVSETDWVRQDDLRRPIQAAPPVEARPGERWIDIDLKRQTVVAYSGEVPIFATLASTGRGVVNSDAATPPGTFRIWVKLRTSDMDNLENVAANENYAIEAVPWVSFFKAGYGLHGTFWHRRFGEVRSHGCVNLTPRDAERLFHWSSPRLFPGWTAAFPTSYEPGTLVRVRAE